MPVDSLREQPQPPPGTGSNVERGTGYLGGAVVRTVEVPVDS